MDYVIKYIYDKDDMVGYSYIDIGDIDSSIIMDFVNLNGDVKTVEFTKRVRTRENLLAYLSENGIDSVIGIGTTNVFKVGFHESKLLEYLDYNGVVKGFNADIDYRYTVLWCLEDRYDNILYEVNSRCMTISQLILNYPSCYTIEGDILIVLATDIELLPSYKLLCSREEFDRLITKVKTLERSI